MKLNNSKARTPHKKKCICINHVSNNRFPIHKNKIQQLGLYIGTTILASIFYLSSLVVLFLACLVATNYPLAHTTLTLQPSFISFHRKLSVFLLETKIKTRNKMSFDIQILPPSCAISIIELHASGKTKTR